MFNVNIEAINGLMLKHKIKNNSQLASKMNISRSQVSKVLNCKCEPGKKFMDAFKIAFPKADINKYFFSKSVA